jgi:hypothetical protein
VQMAVVEIGLQEALGGQARSSSRVARPNGSSDLQISAHWVEPLRLNIA